MFVLKVSIIIHGSLLQIVQIRGTTRSRRVALNDILDAQQYGIVGKVGWIIWIETWVQGALAVSVKKYVLYIMY